MIAYASAGLLLGVLLAAVGLRFGWPGRPAGGPATIEAPVRWRPPDDRGAAPRESEPREVAPPEIVEPPRPQVATVVTRPRRPGMNNSRFGRGPVAPARAALGARAAGSRPR